MSTKLLLTRTVSTPHHHSEDKLRKTAFKTTPQEIQHKPFFLCLFSFFIALQTVKRHSTFPIPWGAEVFPAGMQIAVGIAYRLCWTVHLSPYKQLRDTRPLLFLEGDRGCLHCISSALHSYVTLRGFAVPKEVIVVLPHKQGIKRPVHHYG